MPVNIQSNEFYFKNRKVLEHRDGVGLLALLDAYTERNPDGGAIFLSPDLTQALRDALRPSPTAKYGKGEQHD